MESSKKRGPSCLEGSAPDISFKRRSLESLGVKLQPDIEYDETRIQARLKQIGFGKNTVAYDNYITAVPKDKRKGYKEHPRTPDPYEVQSKRAFDGRVKAWRRALHAWDTDPPPPEYVPAKNDQGEIIFPLKFVPKNESADKVPSAGPTCVSVAIATPTVPEMSEMTNREDNDDDDDDDVL